MSVTRMFVPASKEESRLVRYLSGAINPRLAVAQILTNVMVALNHPGSAENTLKKVRDILRKAVCYEKAEQYFCEDWTSGEHSSLPRKVYVIRALGFYKKEKITKKYGGELDRIKEGTALFPIIHRLKRALEKRDVKYKKITFETVFINEKKNTIDFVFKIE